MQVARYPSPIYLQSEASLLQMSGIISGIIFFVQVATSWLALFILMAMPCIGIMGKVLDVVGIMVLLPVYIAVVFYAMIGRLAPGALLPGMFSSGFVRTVQFANLHKLI